MDRWTYEHGITLQFTRPGKPIENAYRESFNGKLREERLDATGSRAQRTRSAHYRAMAL
jgi:transposase InsO family protein